MRVLVLPQERTNPYQELLYAEMRRRGARVSYLKEPTGSQTLNLLLLPLETAAGRLRGARVAHLHWVYAFDLVGSDRSAFLRLVAEAWFYVWLWTVRLLGLRLVWTAHNTLPLGPVFANDLRARRRLVAACDLVIAHSRATLDELASLGMVPRRSAVIPHGPFTRPAEPDLARVPGDGQGARQFLFFGKVRPYKGVDILLEAFAALPPEAGAHLTVAGECADPALAARLAALAERAPGRVTLRFGWVAGEDTARLLAAADAVVLPFRHITTSGSALLALGHGRPLVVPDLPGLAELPDDAVVRYDGTVPGLTRALADVTEADGAVLAKMSAAALAHVATMTWGEIADRTLSEIGNFLASR